MSTFLILGIVALGFFFISSNAKSKSKKSDSKSEVKTESKSE